MPTASSEPAQPASGASLKAAAKAAAASGGGGPSSSPSGPAAPALVFPTRPATPPAAAAARDPNSTTAAAAAAAAAADSSPAAEATAAAESAGPSPASSTPMRRAGSIAFPDGPAGAAGTMTEVPDKAGWVWKFATGRSVLGRRNWKCRYLVSNVEGLSYFEKQPFHANDKPKGFLPWDAVTHLYAIVNSAIDPAANDPEMSYFGLRFHDSVSSNKGAEHMLLLRVESGTERKAWVTQIQQMSAEADRIREMLDDDDAGGSDGPAGRAARRKACERGAVLGALQTKLRTMVSLKKQRFVKDGLNLDLAYITDRIIAMGYPASGKEAVFRNPYTEVLDFFGRYHPRGRYRVYNLCSERAYPPSYFGGRFERYPFDDHCPPPLALVPQFIASVRQFLDADPANVVAIHCKAGKGRTGMMICCLLMALDTCGSTSEALEFFGKKRTQDGKGVQIPSQRRFIGYYEQMARLYSDREPPAPSIKITSIVLSMTPRFDPDGGCDPFLVVTRRRADHRHIPLGTAEMTCDHPYELVYDSRRLTPPAHVKKGQRDVRVSFREAVLPGGELRLEVIDFDQVSKNDTMLSFWLHTGFMSLDGKITLTKAELDDACKDKSNALFDSDFIITVHYNFVDSKGGKKTSSAAAGGSFSGTNDASPPSTVVQPASSSGKNATARHTPPPEFDDL